MQPPKPHYIHKKDTTAAVALRISYGLEVGKVLKISTKFFTTQGTLTVHTLTWFYTEMFQITVSWY